MMVAGHEDDEHRDPRAVGVDQQGGQQRAAGRADEEDVDGAERRARAPQPVRHHRRDDRADHGERRRTAAPRSGMPRMANSTGVGHEVLDRRERRGRQHDETEEPEGLGRVDAVQPVVGAARRTGWSTSAATAADGRDRAPAERADPVVLPQEEAGQHRHGEQPEADRREGDDGRAQRADPDAAGRRPPPSRSARAPRRRRPRRARPASRTGRAAARAAGRRPARRRRRDGDDQERPLPPALPPARAAIPPTSSGLSV